VLDLAAFNDVLRQRLRKRPVGDVVVGDAGAVARCVVALGQQHASGLHAAHSLVDARAFGAGVGQRLHAQISRRRCFGRGAAFAAELRQQRLFTFTQPELGVGLGVLGHIRAAVQRVGQHKAGVDAQAGVGGELGCGHAATEARQGRLIPQRGACALQFRGGR